jgi:cytochrome d ubiquinol oxidase subunit II
MTGFGWGLLLAVLAAGWMLVDGAAQGGLQLSGAVTGRGRGRDGRRRTLLAVVGPLLLLGEVWLVAAAGVLVGAFWHVESALWSAGYPLVVALVAAWVLRDAAVWLRSRLAGVRWRAGWDAVGRWAGVALPGAFGGLLGVAWWEFALPPGQAVTGPGAVAFGAAPVLLAVLCVLGVRIHGGLLLAARLPLTMAEGAAVARRQVGASLGLLTVVAALTALAALGVFGGGGRSAVVAVVLLLLAAVWSLAALFDLDRGAPGAFAVRAAGVVAAVLPVAVTAAVVGPQVVAAAAPSSVLVALTAPVLGAAVLVAVAQGFAWRALRGPLGRRTAAFL